MVNRGYHLQMIKSEKKEAKFRILVQDIETFIADWEMSNHHYCREEDIAKAFSSVKPKKVKKALKELR